MDEIKSYSKNLVKGGLLLLSVFYVRDITDLTKEAEKWGLREQQQDERESWASLLLKKTT